MNKTVATILAYLLGLTLIAAPVMLSTVIAQGQARNIETGKAQLLADEVLRRADDTSTQIHAALAALNANRGASACTASEIALMRKLDISSSYLQSLARVDNGRIVCSSLGQHGTGIALPAPDYVSKPGVAMRLSVTLPFAPQSRFLIAEKYGYAAIVHQGLVFDVRDVQAGTALAVFGAGTDRLLVSQGSVDPAWLRPLAKGAASSWIDHQRIVAMRKSAHYDIIAMAVVPAAAAHRLADELTLILAPFGLLFGLMLAVGLNLIVRRQISVPALLRAALRRDEFFMVYQPIVQLSTRRCIGAEALLRWRRPDGSMVRPDLFIPIAEETGIITTITRRVLALIEREVPALVAAFPQLHVSINLSSRDLQSGEIVDQLAGLMRRSGIKPANLVVEATERGLINVDLAKAVVHEIRSTGIGVAIDDFGTGYSCLSYLTTLNVDSLKIDKSFVDTIGTGAPTNSVVLHIIEMAKSLNLVTVAEGVETEAQAEFLHRHGVQFAQGWLFAKPMTSDDFLRYLRADVVDCNRPFAACSALAPTIAGASTARPACPAA